MKAVKSLLTLALLAGSTLAFAQQAAPTPAPAASAYVPPPWTHKTPNLNKTQVDALLAHPKKLVIIDVRRPDELTKNGGFQVYLNIQLKDLVHVLDFIPRDRQILLVSNRAHRAGDAGDLLSAFGFKVAGATGSQDYLDAGGTIYKVAPPAPKPAN